MVLPYRVLTDDDKLYRAELTTLESITVQGANPKTSYSVRGVDPETNDLSTQD